MCEPTSIVLGGLSLATSVGGAIAQHHAQNAAASAQDAANAKYARGVTDSANRSAAFQNTQLDAQAGQEQLAADQAIAAIATRRAQERTAARRSIVDVEHQAQMADATARVSSGAAGVAGASVQAIVSDVAAQAGQARKSVGDNLSMVDHQLTTQAGIVRQNLSVTLDNIALQRQGVEVDRQNRINGVQNLPTTPRANPFATALQIVGAGVDFATQYNQLRKPAGT